MYTLGGFIRFVRSRLGGMGAGVGSMRGGRSVLGVGAGSGLAGALGGAQSDLFS